jgi:YbgC/YbaW family acyl-CoA thioester hydrolase
VTRQIQLALAAVRPRKADPSVPVLGPSITRMRVHPGDLDYYWHVNNGVYLQMMDVARTNYMADVDALGALKERGWYAVVAASTMKYRRSLKLGDRFEIRTQVLGWDERVVYMEQAFWRGEDLCARGLVAGRFLHRDGSRVPAPDVIAFLAGLHDREVERPELPADVAVWASSVDVAAR